MEDTQVRFQLDSGAKANVMSLKTYSNLQRHPLPLLKKTHTVLVSFSKHKLKPRGEVVLSTRYKDKVEDVKFFVAKPEVESVLSGNTCVKLGLLKRVHQLTHKNSPKSRVELEDYPELFKGLGCLPGTYHIELTDGACRGATIKHNGWFIDSTQIRDFHFYNDYNRARRKKSGLISTGARGP